MEDNIIMVNFCLNDGEKSLLKSLIGKKLLYFKHDPFDKFEGETVYGRIELLFKDLILLINYDYAPYPLFGSKVDDHPKFSINTINDNEAVSALQNTEQITVACKETIKGINLVEDFVKVEWDGKYDEVRMLKAIIFKFNKKEVAVQGDYMIPLLSILKGESLKESIDTEADEFEDSETKYECERSFIEL